MSGGLRYKGPINPNPGPGESSIIIYSYVPSLALGIVGVITFAAIFLVNLYYLISKGRRHEAGHRNKGHRTFHILICVGAVMEAGGYAARIASHYRPFVVGSFIAQYFLIVVAPVLFSAAIYLSLTLLTRHQPSSEKLLVLRPKLILAFFVTSDVICTIIQVTGAALIGVSESARAQGKGEESPVTPEQANDILLAGLAVQCFTFSVFLLILSWAIYRSTRSTVYDREHGQLKKTLWVIWSTSILILLRTVFRLAETAQGFFGYASTHEWLFAILEYLPVILALIIWAIWPPRRLLPVSVTGTERVDSRDRVEKRGEALQAA